MSEETIEELKIYISHLEDSTDAIFEDLKALYNLCCAHGIHAPGLYKIKERYLSMTLHDRCTTIAPMLQLRCEEVIK